MAFANSCCLFIENSPARIKRIARMEPAEVERGRPKAKRTRSGDAAAVTFWLRVFIGEGSSVVMLRFLMVLIVVAAYRKYGCRLFFSCVSGDSCFELQFQKSQGKNDRHQWDTGGI